MLVKAQIAMPATCAGLLNSLRGEWHALNRKRLQRDRHADVAEVDEASLFAYQYGNVRESEAHTCWPDEQHARAWL